MILAQMGEDTKVSGYRSRVRWRPWRPSTPLLVLGRLSRALFFKIIDFRALLGFVLGLFLGCLGSFFCKTALPLGYIWLPWAFLKTPWTFLWPSWTSLGLSWSIPNISWGLSWAILSLFLLILRNPQGPQDFINKPFKLLRKWMGYM